MAYIVHIDRRAPFHEGADCPSQRVILRHITLNMINEAATIAQWVADPSAFPTR